MRARNPLVGGQVEPGFEPVEAAFQKTLREPGEFGAACAVSHQGELVVDLWGGYRDARRSERWTEDTLVLVFSTTKGVAAAAMAHARSRGYFEYDDRVADYWPAFAQHGKADVTIRQLLAHQAGLAAIGRNLTSKDVADSESLANRLAGKEPDWVPGTRHGYHAWSLGWYESELLRRTDPHGRSLGTYAAAELFEPLDETFHIGVPESADERVAHVEPFSPLDALRTIGSFPPRLLLGLANPFSTVSQAMNPFDVSTPAELNDPEWRRLEVPAGNGVGTARSLARLYGSLATDGEPLGIDRETLAALAAHGTPPTRGRRDVILGTDTSYSLGFWKPFDGFRFGSGTAFGAPGAGGSFAFADPDRELGFAYTPNRMGTHVWDDPRELRLRRAVEQSLAGR
ncbi:serine hydrolase domain-containing protein [Halobaculum lipolyticum]|uniref:Serine hydrolase domain-containing protein n=2 Tax=Halobaculum lipolyticum TaxID=3032001 RepID=A0ABD5WI06_9EURY